MGWGSSTSRGEGQKALYVPRNAGKSNLWAGYLGIFAGIYPSCAQKVLKKGQCLIFGPYQRGDILRGDMWGGKSGSICHFAFSLVLQYVGLSRYPGAGKKARHVSLSRLRVVSPYVSCQRSRRSQKNWRKITLVKLKGNLRKIKG